VKTASKEEKSKPKKQLFADSDGDEDQQEVVVVKKEVPKATVKVALF